MVRTLQEMSSMMKGMTETMTSLLAGIASVSLLVGGIGIMNIMLVSVTERTKEIGLRRAIGATSANVLTQFLVEACALSLAGGAVGVGLGIAISAAARTFLAWPAAVGAQSIVLSFGFAAVVGVFFGYYPARRAAALQPIEALRYE
jgi:putative ABC transport system permease protein